MQAYNPCVCVTQENGHITHVVLCRTTEEANEFKKEWDHAHDIWTDEEEHHESGQGTSCTIEELENFEYFTSIDSSKF